MADKILIDYWIKKEGMDGWKNKEWERGIKIKKEKDRVEKS